MNPFDDRDPFLDHDSFDDESMDDAQIREIESRMNIHRLKAEAKEITGAEMSGFESRDAPAEVLEQFWKNIVEFERAPRVSLQQKLAAADISLPPATQLSDEALPAHLWQLIEFMAQQGIYLSDTDHLSDRQLYEYLLEQAGDALNDFPGMACFLSPIGSCDEADMQINFRYYADDDARARWLESYPDYEMPPRETPPYSRDHLLPQGTLPHLMFDETTGEWKKGRLEDDPAYWEELEDEDEEIGGAN